MTHILQRPDWLARVEENFLGGNDLIKADVFTNIEAHGAPIREKVEAWVKAVWWTWEQEKPEWFTDNWKAMVPKEKQVVARA